MSRQDEACGFRLAARRAHPITACSSARNLVAACSRRPMVAMADNSSPREVILCFAERPAADDEAYYHLPPLAPPSTAAVPPTIVISGPDNCRVSRGTP